MIAPEHLPNSHNLQVEVELRERMDLIMRMSRALADRSCDECEGDGIDREGSEWSLCECVKHRLERMEHNRL
jgi:hypothetical protein